MQSIFQDKTYTVLLVEDSPTDTELFSEMLTEAEGPRFRTTSTSSLAEASGMWDKKGPWDAIILDLSLPDAEATKALSAMRDKVPASVPVVVLTGSSDPELVNQALENGAHDYLVKDTADKTLLVHTLHYAILRTRLEYERELLRKKREENERLETLGRLSAGIAHDFNNLNTIIRGNAELMQSELSSDTEWHKYLDDIINAVRRAKGLIDGISAFAGTTAEQFNCLDVNTLLLNMQADIRTAAGDKRQVTFDISRASSVPVNAQHEQLSLALRNLVNNAVEATEENKGVITLKTGLVDKKPQGIAERLPISSQEEGPFAYIEITDNGFGINGQNEAKLFDPFYSTKFIGRGLGLAAVAGIVRDHHGAVTVNGKSGQGASFCVLLPCAEEDPGA